jgi:hypothetical protein
MGDQYELSETAQIIELRQQLEQKDAELRRLEAVLLRFLREAPAPLIKAVLKGQP